MSSAPFSRPFPWRTNSASPTRPRERPRSRLPTARFPITWWNARRGSVSTKCASRRESTSRSKSEYPMGAGLGGGSSDAAAQSYCPCPVLAGKMIPLSDCSWKCARRLAATCLSFCYGGTALGSGQGRGTLSAAGTAKPRPGLLIAAWDVHVSTPDAYRGLSAALREYPNRNWRPFQQACWEDCGFAAVTTISKRPFLRDASRV